MTVQPMAGVRVLEVAQFTFTPAAGAVLADWGADVIKVEHAVTGDAQRGLQIGTGGVSEGAFHPLMEHPNRGKRSIGLALEIPAARTVLLELAAEQRCVPDQLFAIGENQTGHRRGGPPGSQSRHHLCTWQCSRTPRVPRRTRVATTEARSGPEPEAPWGQLHLTPHE